MLRDGEFETLEGRINGVGEGRVDFSLDERNARIKLEKIEGLVFYHASGRELVDPLCDVQLVDGSSLKTRRLEYRQEKFWVETVAGTRLTLPLDSIVNVSCGQGRVVFLGNQKPTSVDWSPVLRTPTVNGLLRKLNLPRANQGFAEQPLELLLENEKGVLERKSFATGWAVKSGSKLAFSVGKQFQRLEGWVGFSPDVRTGGNVKLRIRGDARILYESEWVNRQESKAAKLQLDIDGVSRIVIDVLENDGRTIGDTLHFGDLRVVR